MKTGEEKDRPTMTIQEMGDVYYSEKGSNRLTKLPDRFYERATSYIKQLQGRLSNTRSEEPGKFGEDAYQSSEEIHRAREILERIYNTRERKIVLAALNSARGIKQDLKEMEAEEDDLYYETKLVFSENRDRILRYDRLTPRPQRIKPETGINTTTDDFMDAPPENVVDRDVPEEQKGKVPPRENAKEEPVREKKRVPDQSIAVRAIKDVGEFADLDGSTIDLRKEDVIILDRGMAKVLFEGGMVEYVEG